MKISALNQKRKMHMKVRNPAAVTIDLASRIAKAESYLEQTSALFASNVQKANRHLNDFEGGVFAGPITR